MPSKAPWRNFFRDFLKDPLGPVPAPAGAKDSAPEGLAAVKADGLATGEAEAETNGMKKEPEVVPTEAAAVDGVRVSNL